MVDQLQPVLDARPAVGNLREIVLAERLLAGEAEGAMVGGNHLKLVVLKAIPQFRLVLFGPERGRQHVFGAFETGPLEVFDGEQQVLRAGLREDRHAAVAGLAYLVERVFRTDVDDVDRRTRDLRDGNGAACRSSRRPARSTCCSPSKTSSGPVSK